MEAFVETLPEGAVSERLADALGGRGSFRRFRDALADHPAARESWHTFRAERVRLRVLAWLDDEGIEPRPR